MAKVPKADDGDYASVLGGENVAICKGANVEKSCFSFKLHDC